MIECTGLIISAKWFSEWREIVYLILIKKNENCFRDKVTLILINYFIFKSKSNNLCPKGRKYVREIFKGLINRKNLNKKIEKIKKIKKIRGNSRKIFQKKVRKEC